MMQEEIITWHKGDKPPKDGEYLITYGFDDELYSGWAMLRQGKWRDDNGEVLILQIFAWAHPPTGWKEE